MEHSHIYYELRDIINVNEHTADPEEEEDTIFYFKRIWNRHCPRNDRLRVITSEFITELGIDGIKIEFCNKIEKKLGTLLRVLVFILFSFYLEICDFCVFYELSRVLSSDLTLKCQSANANVGENYKSGLP